LYAAPAPASSVKKPKHFKNGKNNKRVWGYSFLKIVLDVNEERKFMMLQFVTFVKNILKTSEPQPFDRALAEIRLYQMMRLLAASAQQHCLF
jgi:hypothetical protein